MEEMVDVLEMTITLWCKGDRWEGTGYWIVDTRQPEWPSLVTVITRAVAAAIAGFIKAEDYRIRLEGQKVCFYGPQAARLVKEDSGLSLDDPGRIKWHTFTQRIRSKKEVDLG